MGHSLSPTISQGPKCPYEPGTPQYSSHQRPPTIPSGISPQDKGKSSPVLDPGLQEPCMGTIWYSLPLCTIFSQKFNVDYLKTQLFHFNSSHQSTNPFQRKDPGDSSL
ncbi:hypothetical protein O181_012639 [Austropuccinia psidii MF-1]|uniref:Uncharacterized protein n=1 Tax=Austropuccinia psidii MF-1 TaxID=1389203 RepID=A0A9Q3BWQ8_9BASI|nr:hypothetical protein [Austropuccinia psidii MF-1]